MPPYFLTPIDPPSRENSQAYERRPSAFFFTATPIAWRWGYDRDGNPGGLPPSPIPSARALVDGAAVTDWTPATQDTHHVWGYDFSFTVPDGHHLFSMEVEGLPASALTVIEKGFVLNTSGAPLPNQAPWTTRSRFETVFTNGIEAGAQQITYPGALPSPPSPPLKVRAPAPYATRLAPDKLWIRRVAMSIEPQMVRRFVTLPTGDIDIENDQKYFYADVPGREGPPRLTLRDGPRGVGCLGMVYKFKMHRGGAGAYFTEPQGRLGFLNNNGKVTTVVGWRVKPDTLKLHGGLYQDFPDLYAQSFEVVGDWSQAGPDDHYLNEPWGFEAAPFSNPADLGYHEFWACVTLQHRILYLNHYTAHSPAGYALPSHPPAGYIPPPAPTGATQIFPFIQGPSDLCNEPWDCALGPDGKLYWTNFGNGSICRANLDGTGAERVTWTEHYFSNEEIGFTNRLDRCRNRDHQNQIDLQKDGGPGVAWLIRPQAIAFTSDGRCIFCERYTWLIRELDTSTGNVRTLGKMDVGPAGAGIGLYDVAMAIDTQGSVGPADDIFVSCWTSPSQYRFDKTGGYLGRWCRATQGERLLNGPMSYSRVPNYAWGVGIRDGRIWFAGNQGAWQFQEIVQKMPTDPAIDINRYERGYDAFRHGSRPPMSLLHGPAGQGELGLPTIEEMGAWSDDTIKSYGISHGIPAAEADDFLYWVRWMTVDFDYSAFTFPNP